MARSKCSVNRWNVLFVVGVVVRASPINSAQDYFGRAVDSTIRFFSTFQVRTIEWTLFATPSIRKPLQLSLTLEVSRVFNAAFYPQTFGTHSGRSAWNINYNVLNVL